MSTRPSRKNCKAAARSEPADMSNREIWRENRATILFLVIFMPLIALSVYGCFYEAWEHFNVRCYRERPACHRAQLRPQGRQAVGIVRDRDAERFGRGQIDNKIELVGCSTGRLPGLCCLLLRTGCEWPPRGSATQKADEFPSPHAFAHARTTSGIKRISHHYAVHYTQTSRRHVMLRQLRSVGFFAHGHTQDIQ